MPSTAGYTGHNLASAQAKAHQRRSTLYGGYWKPLENVAIANQVLVRPRLPGFPILKELIVRGLSTAVSATSHPSSIVRGFVHSRRLTPGLISGLSNKTGFTPFEGLRSSTGHRTPGPLSTYLIDGGFPPSKGVSCLGSSHPWPSCMMTVFYSVIHQRFFLSVTFK